MLTHEITPDSRGGVRYLFKPSYAIGAVPSLSGHAVTYLWRSPLRVRRHRASSPQSSFSNECCLCITMDQLKCVFVCVIIPFILDVKLVDAPAGVAQEDVAFSEYFFRFLFVRKVCRTFFPSGWCFFYLVTTGWVFDISLCENSINQSIKVTVFFFFLYLILGYSL